MKFILDVELDVLIALEKFHSKIRWGRVQNGHWFWVDFEIRWFWADFEIRYQLNESLDLNEIDKECRAGCADYAGKI